MKCIRLTTEEFITRAITLNGNRYDYSKVIHTAMNEKITIICKEHGEFRQTSGSHLNNRHCPVCAIKTHDRKRRTMYKQILESFKQKHSIYKYPEYPMEKRMSSKDTIRVFCPIHSCYFYPTINNHSRGSTCPKCGNSRKGSLRRNYRDKPTILYILKLINTNIYKVGITSTTLNIRYQGQLNKIEILYTKQYSNGVDAYDKEQDILLKSAEFTYKGKKLLKEGNTELRTVNLLKYI